MTEELRVKYRQKLGAIICEPADRGDLAAVRELAQGFFEQEFASLQQMRAWHTHSGTIAWKIEKANHKSGIQGSFCLVPLNKTGLQKLRLGEISGAHLQTRHLASPSKSPKAWYVGYVAARFRMQPVITQLFWQTLNTKLPDPQSLVLARPISSTGKNLAERMNMEPLLGSPNLWGAYRRELHAP